MNPLRILVALAWATTAAATVAAPLEPQHLLHQYKCYVCHSDDVPKAGPAYADIAAAYRSDRRAVSQVSAIIRRGQHGGGPWHMPPHPEVSRAEADAMARYILSVERRHGAEAPSTKNP